jgi:hypothetical protein
MNIFISRGACLKITSLILIGVLTVLAVPSISLADPPPNGAGPGAIVTVPTPVAESSVGTVQELVQKVIAFLGWVIGITSTIGVLIGAALYVFSAGDPNKTRVAKDAIIYSIVGLVIAILAYGIVTFVIGKAN